MSAKKPKKVAEEHKKIIKFIEKTKSYLLNKENANFIKKFEIINKIREQILSITSAIPNSITSDIPKELIDFYTAPISQGGLQGVAQDLNNARLISPNVICGITYSEPYKLLLTTAQKLNYAISRDPNKNFILHGDTQYRKMLGLNIDPNSFTLENKITSQNIGIFLENSFEFLYSLDKSQDINKPLENSYEFILYRMLLLKQLSVITNPNNLCFEKSIKQEVLEFIQDKLKIEPALVINDIFNQSLFSYNNDDNKCTPIIKDPLGQNILVCDLEFIAEAVRLDIAYTSNHVTPKMIIDIEASKFILRKNEASCMLFGYYQGSKLVPEISSSFFEKISTTIANSREFILSIMDKKLMGNFSCLKYYLYFAKDETKNLQVSIDKLLSLINTNNLPSTDLSYIKSARDLLVEYKQEIDSLLEFVQIWQSSYTSAALQHRTDKSLFTA